MRRVLSDELDPGMVLGQEVSDPAGSMTLGQGTVLTESWIERICKWKIGSVVIQDQKMTELAEEELQSILQTVLEAPQEFVKKKKIEKTPQQKVMDIVDSVEIELRGLFLRARCTGLIPVLEFERLANKTLYPLVSASGIFLFLHSLTRSENYLYRHAVDSAILAGLIGRWLNLPEEDIRNLVCAGLVQDIGKARVYFEVLSNPGPLNATQQDMARGHVYYSYKFLSETKQISDKILDGVYQHHERIDGSGYPLGLQEDQIGIYGKILAIVDVYEALVSNRYYKEAISPIAAVEIMLNDMAGSFDQRVLRIFCDHLRQFLVGESVQLSNGERGKIVMFHAFPSMRPLIHSANGMVIDLAAQPDIRIERLDI